MRRLLSLLDQLSNFLEVTLFLIFLPDFHLVVHAGSDESFRNEFEYFFVVLEIESLCLEEASLLGWAPGDGCDTAVMSLEFGFLPDSLYQGEYDHLSVGDSRCQMQTVFPGSELD